MYCVNHEYDEAVYQCTRCGVHLCARCNAAEGEKPALCVECSEQLRSRRRRIMRILSLVLLCSGALLLNHYGLDRLGLGGRADTDEAQYRIDDCIATFEDIGDRLQLGQLPTDDMICPPGAEPYRIERDGDLITVHHPDPAYLGYNEVYVTNKDPNPIMN